VTKAAFARASRRIALIDSTKFGTRALISMASLEQLDLVITDEGLDAEHVDDYRAAGVPLTQ
jgi:DeoR/GlpR family transcriptional regulator of sugar metabolism